MGTGCLEETTAHFEQGVDLETHEEAGLGLAGGRTNVTGLHDQLDKKDSICNLQRVIVSLPMYSTERVC